MDITHEMHDFFRSLCAHEGLLSHVDWSEVENREYDEHDEEGFGHLSATRDAVDLFVPGHCFTVREFRTGRHPRGLQRLGREWRWLGGAQATPSQIPRNVLAVQWSAEWTVFYMELV